LSSDFTYIFNFFHLGVEFFLIYDIKKEEIAFSISSIIFI